MKLAKTIRMPTGMEKIPVVSVAPQAGFVSPAYGGLKPIGQVEWSTQSIVPEEIAVTLSIPNAFLDDAGFPVWENVRPLVASAIAKTFDAAVLSGTNAPASYPAGGLVAPAWATAVAAGATASAALGAAFSTEEGKGLDVDGILGGPALNSLMRTLGIGFEQAQTPPTSIWGVPFSTTPTWAIGGTAPYKLALVGGWEYVIVGIREDLQIDLSTEGVLTDGAGKVLVNAFQQDSTLMRAYMRVGVAVGKPVGLDGTTATPPLALSQMTVAPAAFTAEGEPAGDEAPTTTRRKTS